MLPFVRAGLGRVLLVVPVIALGGASSALAHTADSGGGVSYVEPEVRGLKCEAADSSGCPRGAELRVRGEGLAGTTSVVFRGKQGATDDLTAQPIEAAAHSVVVRVPVEAKSGPVSAVAATSSADGPRLKVSKTRVQSASINGPGAFPIRGKHTYGDGLGAGRGHEGQDIFASCGKRLVSALDGTVTIAKWQDRAGNYVVIKADDGTSQAYMHMAAPAIVKAGQRVSAGQQIGEVGDTGRATGCHLHFELWSSPGWYEGGSPMDPLPLLKTWDRTS
jgi:murein DD-endopeptidase MepM/ murein hydrolase activator NlpD